MMDSWYQASPLSALEVEARRVAAEEGRFPPNAPGMTHYSSGVVEYNDLPRTHSRSRSDSSCGTPPAYPDNRLNCTRAGQGHLPATFNHGNTSCSDQFLPVTNYVEECISYHQPPWKSDHKIGTSHHDLSAAFTTPNQHSNLYDLLWRRRPSHALQSRSVANPGFQAGYSSSSSPSSAQKQAQIYPPETRPYHYPGRYTFINQVFKPLYKTDREKEAGNNHALTSGDQKSSQLNVSGSLGKLDLSKSTKSRYEPYDRLSTTAVKKSKRANEKRFPCPECGRMFARAFNMETHRKTHIGYRPHHCPKCQKSFSRRHDLHRHLAAVHDERGKLRPQGTTVQSANQDQRNTPKNL